MSSHTRLPLPPPLPRWRRYKTSTNVARSPKKQQIYFGSTQTSPKSRAKHPLSSSPRLQTNKPLQEESFGTTQTVSNPSWRSDEIVSAPLESFPKSAEVADTISDPSVWAQRIKLPENVSVVENTISSLSSVLNEGRKSSVNHWHDNNRASSSSNHGVRLAPLSLEQIHSTDPSVASSATSIFKRKTPRNMRSLLRNFLVDEMGELNSHVDFVAHAIDSGQAITNALVQDIVQHHPSIESMNLRACHEITDVGLWAIAQFCKRLEKIVLAQAESFTHIGLRSLTLKCTHIKWIDLSHCPQVNDATIRVIAGGCGNLEHLNVSYCTKITDISLSEVAQCCLKLKQMLLTCCKGISQFGDYALKDAGSNLVNLEILNCIRCPYIRNEGVNGLAAGACTGTLRRLRFTACAAGLKGNVPSTSLSKFSRLQHLQLAGWKKTADRDLQTICTKLINLQVLDISGSELITAKGIENLSKIPKLIDLNLQDCQHIGSVKSMKTLMEACPQLEKLNLYRCGEILHQPVVDSLFAGCTRLATLNLSETKQMNLNYVQNLATKLPFSVPHVRESKKLRHHKESPFLVSAVDPHPERSPNSKSALSKIKSMESQINDEVFGSVLDRIDQTKLVNPNWLTPHFFGLVPVENYYQRVRDEEERIRGRFASIRIQAFLRGAIARGGVAKLREKYLQIKAAGLFQAAFRGLKGRQRARKVVELVKKIKFSVLLSRVWRGSVIRYEVTKQKRMLELAKNQKVAAVMCQSVIRGHLARAFVGAIVRDRALAAQRASLEKFRRERAAVTIQCMFRTYRSKGLYWAAVTGRRNERRLHKLRRLSAMKIQSMVRQKFARDVLSQLRDEENFRRFVKAVTLLQARVQSWKARAIAQLLREEKQWHEYQWYSAQVIQRCWRRSRSRFTVQILRSLAALGREETKAACIIQNFARYVRGRNLYWTAIKARAEMRKKNKAQTLIKRIWFGAQARQVAEVFRALVKARRDAAPIYEAVEDLENKRRETNKKLKIVLRKHGVLLKQRNNVAAELRQVLKTRQKFYDSTTMQPGVPQRFKVAFLKKELRIRLEEAKNTIKPLMPVIESLDEEINEIDAEINMLKAKLKPYEEDIKAKAIRNRRERIKKSIDTQIRAAVQMQAAFRGQRTREALRRSGGINYWILTWDEEDERDVYFNTFTGDKTWYKPPEMNLFAMTAKRPHEATKWVEEWDTTAGAYFYYNTRTGEYRWEKPPDFDIDLGDSVQGEGLEWFDAKKNEIVQTNSTAIEQGSGDSNYEPVSFGALTTNTHPDKNDAANSNERTEQDYLSSQPTTGRTIYAWEELIDEKSERTYYKNTVTGEVKWSLSPHEALSSEAGLRVTQALIAENPLWQGVSGIGIDIPDDKTGLKPVTLEDSATLMDHIATTSIDNVEDTNHKSGAQVLSTSTNNNDTNDVVTSQIASESQTISESPHVDDTLPDDWEEVEDEESGSTFYFNRQTNESRWERPIRRVQQLVKGVAAIVLGTSEVIKSAADTTIAGASQDNEDSIEDSQSDKPLTLIQSSSIGNDIRNQTNFDQDTRETNLTNVDPFPTKEVNEVAANNSENEANEILIEGKTKIKDDSIAGRAWEVLTNEQGEIYYYNNVTGEKKIDRPDEFEATDMNFINSKSDTNDELEKMEIESEIIGKWEVLTNGDGVTYYYHTETGETSFERPDVEIASKLQASTEDGIDEQQSKQAVQPKNDLDLDHASDVPENWEEIVDENSGSTYYYNRVSGESRWNLPRQMLLAMSALTAMNMFSPSNDENTSIEIRQEDETEWETIEEDNGSVYYYNTLTGESTWDNPYS